MPNLQEIENYFSSLNGDILIEVEMHPDRQTSFNKRYVEITGNEPPEDTPRSPYYVLGENADKWGVELRIYFTPEGNMPDGMESLITNNSRHNPQTDEFSHRLNNNDVVWHLFGQGFTLGRQ